MARETSRKKNIAAVTVADTPTDISVARKTRVLVVSHNHPDFFPGGSEKLAYQLFRQTNASDSHTAVFLAATGAISRESAHPGTPFLSHNGKADEFLFWGDAFDYLMQTSRNHEALHNEFAEFLKAQSPDVVHFHHTLRFGVEAIRVVRDVLPQAAIIYTLHDFIPICNRDGQMLRKTDDSLCSYASPARCHECFPHIPANRFKLRELTIKQHFELVDAFVSPSRMLIERFVEWGLPRDKMHLIQNGVDTSPVMKINSGINQSGADKRNRFSFFGQISPYKGTMLLLDAAEKLLASGFDDFYVNIHGNVSLQSEDFKKAFAEKINKLQSHVAFHGRYDHDSIPKFMENTDWVVVPSIWWENSPLVIAEAFRHAKPVICSNIGGMAEKVQHMENGLHFDVGSSQSLMQQMRKAATTKGLWEKLQAGIMPPPSIAECAQEYIELYGRILRSSTHKVEPTGKKKVKAA